MIMLYHNGNRGLGSHLNPNTEVKLRPSRTAAQAPQVHPENPSIQNPDPALDQNRGMLSFAFINK